MRPVRLAAVMFAAALVCWASEGKSRSLKPYTLTDNFQANNLGQWASYPPVQDVGYDPSLAPAG